MSDKSIDNGESSTEHVEIMYGPYKGVYKVHPIAGFFPALCGNAFNDLRESIREIGQQEPVVLDGNEFLDGRNRVAVLNDLGMEPKIVQFADLQTGLNQGVWIAAKNLERRHLTNDQYLAISARYFDWCKKQPQPSGEGRTEMTENRGDAPDHATSGPDGECVPHDEFPQKAAAIAKPRKRGRPPGQRNDAETLARKTKQTRYRAEQMLKIRAFSPELALAVEEGRLTLKEATSQMRKNETPPKSAEDDTEAKANMRQPDDAKIDRAAIRIIDDARWAARKLRKIDQPHLWERLIVRIQQILRFEHPSACVTASSSATSLDIQQNR